MSVKKEPNSLDLLVIFNAQVSADSMGGGDKIVLNICKKLHRKSNLNLVFAGSEEGRGMMLRSLVKTDFLLLHNITIKKFGLIIAYLLRIFVAPLILFKPLSRDVIVWSASDYLPDVFPAFIYRLFYRRSKWIANLFLQARNPFKKEIEFSAKSLLNFFAQRISILLFKINADHIFVLAKSDLNYLLKAGFKESKISILQGGVDTDEIRQAKPAPMEFDACFIGRFHPQKGIPDLFYSWSLITEKKPSAKLAIIGWGDNKNVNQVNRLIKEYRLSKNVVLLGFLDGNKKFQVLKSSKILLFPSNFESWGVVIAEAIASGVPVVAYRLLNIKDNFKSGVVWIDHYNKNKFAQAALELIRSTQKRDVIIKSAKPVIQYLSWDRSTSLFYKVLRKFN